MPSTDYLLDLRTGETTPLPSWISHGDRNRFTISPDGSLVAYHHRPKDATRRPERQIFIAHLDGTGIRQITHDAKAIQPAWSPDGTMIAYHGRPSLDTRGKIFVIDLESGKTTQVTYERGVVSVPQFSPDGSSIVYTAKRPRGSQVRIVPVTGGTGSRLVGGHGSSASDASLSPDGSLLVYICDDFHSRGADLCLAKADGSHPRVIARNDSDAMGQKGHSSIPTASWSPDGSRIAYWDFHPEKVYIIDVRTERSELVAHGAWPSWVDDRTLIIEECDCIH